MTSYTQLTQVERYQIQALRQHSSTLADIAAELNRHKSTISRELKRNSGNGSYCAEHAQQSTLQRRRGKSPPRITRLTRALVRHKLKQDWSPEQVSLWLAKYKAQRVSHTWIYQCKYQGDELSADAFIDLLEQVNAVLEEEKGSSLTSIKT